MQGANSSATSRATNQDHPISEEERVSGLDLSSRANSMADNTANNMATNNENQLGFNNNAANNAATNNKNQPGFNNDPDPNNFPWRRQQLPPSTTVVGLVERKNWGQSSPSTTSGASEAYCVGFSSESLRSAPCRRDRTCCTSSPILPQINFFWNFLCGFLHAVQKPFFKASARDARFHIFILK